MGFNEHQQRLVEEIQHALIGGAEQGIVVVPRGLGKTGFLGEGLRIDFTATPSAVAAEQLAGRELRPEHQPAAYELTTEAMPRQEGENI